MIMEKQIMNFEVNSNIYKLIVVDELEDSYFGLTKYDESKVVLRKLDINSMIRTLKHELTHVWLWEYGHHQHEREFTHEDVCEIVACSNNFINGIVRTFKTVYAETNTEADTKSKKSKNKAGDYIG